MERNRYLMIKKCQNIPTFVNDVKFHGIAGTKRDALVKEVSGVFSSQTLDDLIRNSYLAARHMQEVGLFESCLPMVDVSSSDRDVYTVNFVVKEPSAFKVGLKLGMTMSGDADASISGGKKSVFGRAESANVSYTKTIRGGHIFDFSSVKPFLGWQKYANIGLSLYRSFDYLRWNKSNLTENALILSYNGRPWSDRLLHSLRLYTTWRYFEPKADSPFPIREHAGHTTKISIENAVGVDTRDRPILASSGAFARFSNEYAGLLGDSAFFKSQFDLQVSKPLFLGLVMSASLRATAVQALANRSIHLLDRVYLGGPYDVRGFEINSIGTRSEMSSLGGAFGCAAALHLYRSLVPVDMLYLHGFVTGGSVSSVRSRNWLRDMMETPRISVGVGLAFVYQNMLRLEINYVHPLRRIANDACSSGFQFGAGINFL